MKSKGVKYLLAVIWLICFMQFRESYVISNKQIKASLHIKHAQSVDYRVIDLYNACLSFLHENHIPYSTQTICQSLGQKLINVEKTKDQRPVQLWFNSFDPFTFDINYCSSLSLSLPTRYFEELFLNYSTRVDRLVFWEDPESWNQSEFQNFYQNSQYLKSKRIAFERCCFEYLPIDYELKTVAGIHD